MWSALRIITIASLVAQVAFSQIQVHVVGVREADKLQADTHLGLATAGKNGRERGLSTGLDQQSGHRELSDAHILHATLTGIQVSLSVTIEVDVSVYDGDGKKSTSVSVDVDVDVNGEAEVEIEVSVSVLNKDMTGLGSGCSVTAVAGACISGDCPHYDKDGTNNGMHVKDPTLIGDPHMVGLLGQKIDWNGVDDAWYCLLSDGPDFQINVRLSAPTPVEFPDRQLVSGVSLLRNDGHSLLVEVKNPYSTETEGCPKESAAPCLADGGLRILVDGEEYSALQSPAEKVRLPGGDIVSSANLPAECRPFGGDRIWAAQYNAKMMADRRSLRVPSPSFDKWILQADNLAAPTWCAKYLEEEGSAGLLSSSSNHATIRVETSAVTLRINAGVNYQDLVASADGTVLVPELMFWQTDLGFEGLQLTNTVTGLLGDTSRMVFNAEGLPVTSGLGALHGPVEGYRVAGPFVRDFDNLHE